MMGNRNIHSLAEKHTGMKISASGILLRVGGYLRVGAEAMHSHLREMSDRYYEGDVKAVDEFLQLYCLDKKRPGVMDVDVMECRTSKRNLAKTILLIRGVKFGQVYCNRCESYDHECSCNPDISLRMRNRLIKQILETWSSNAS